MTMQGVVVGIEGTRAGRAALEWAFREGMLRGVPVKVVHAWNQSAGHDVEGMRASACMVVAAVSEAERAIGGRPEVIECSRPGTAARVLLEESRTADVLVVGRGHRLGMVDVVGRSVSAEVVRHATCPVVVVPDASAGPADVPQVATTVGAVPG